MGCVGCLLVQTTQQLLVCVLVCFFVCVLVVPTSQRTNEPTKIHCKSQFLFVEVEHPTVSWVLSPNVLFGKWAEEKPRF